MSAKGPLLYEKSLIAYQREMLNFDTEPLSREEEIRLIQLAHAGDSYAEERLVLANIRFVISIAKQFQNYGLSLSELIAEGNVGLLIAIRRFDASRGFKLITYAVWWIKQTILKALALNARIVRVPVGVGQKIKGFNKLLSTLEQELGRSPTLEEISVVTGLNEEQVAGILLEEETTREMSLNWKFFKDDPAELLDTIPDQDSFSDSALFEDELIERVMALIRSLPNERDRKIIRMHFGVDGGEPKSLVEIGRVVGLSRERIRQIIEEALEHLREKVIEFDLQI